MGLGGEVGDIEKIFLVRSNMQAAEQPSEAAPLSVQPSEAAPLAVQPSEAAPLSVQLELDQSEIDGGRGVGLIDCGRGVGQSELREIRGELELFVKWKGLAHIHCQWVTRHVLDGSGALNKRRVAKFIKEVSLHMHMHMHMGMGMDMLMHMPRSSRR